MATESRFNGVSDEYLSSLLHKSLQKTMKKSTKYGMKIFNGRNAQNKFELLTIVTVNLTPFATTVYLLFDKTKITIFYRMVFKPNKVTNSNGRDEERKAK